MYEIVGVLCLCAAVHNIPIDDPSDWPGHLEPFGSKQNTVDIEDVLYDWPSPNDFYRNYIDKVKPVLVKGVYKYSTPVKSWTDDYLTNHPDSKTETVLEEPSVIENRSAILKQVSVHEFINTYHKKPILTFSSVPKYLMKDVMLPSPLKCNETTKYLVNTMLNINQGGAKSLVYSDDVESIYCSFRGTVDFLLIGYNKNKNYVIDRPQGGYATIDVQKVDYVKYPDLRKVDRYIRTTLTPGDCLYIPYKWYKQFNSHSNKLGQSISLNVWFNHLHDHYPKECGMADEEATLDKFTYSDVKEEMERNKEEMLTKISTRAGNGTETDVSDSKEDFVEIVEEEENYGGENLLQHFQHYVKTYKRNLTISHFYHIIKKDGRLTQQDHTGLKFPKSFQILVRELYDKLDVDNDNFLSGTDFELMINNEELKRKMERYLEYQTARIEDYVEDLIESKHHDESIHAFDQRKMEEIKSARAFDEL